MAEIYTITHEPSGAIRINQPVGSVLTFGNAAWLAEAHAQSLAQTKRMADMIANISSIANDPKIPAESVREFVLKALNQDVPF